MKKITYIAILFVLSSAQSYADDSVEALAAKILQDAPNVREDRCRKNAEKLQGKYTYKDIYNFCCTSEMIDNSSFPGKNNQARIAYIAEQIKEAEKECVDTNKECFGKRLSDLDFKCENH